MKKSSPANRIFFFALVGLLLVLGLIALSLAAFVISRTRPQANATPPAVPTLAANSLYLGSFRPVQGTRYLVAEVNEEYRGGRSYSSARWFSYSYSDSGGATRNLVFLEGDSLASRRLFDTNENVLIAVNQFPEPVINDTQMQQMIVKGQNQSEEIVTVRCLIIQVAQKDTNKDGKLNGADQQAVLITDAGGNGFTELFTGVEQVYWMEMTSPTSLVMVYMQAGKRKVSMIDTANRAVTSTQALVELGPEVK